ncbi:involucrin repeat protein [Macrophomina phaseolina MS6]|uniref:Involucrin repeat protein n=1 Tax=Macrophomina phaseolina (strain MS6) TaxID=1126212 RepID=K2QUQ8_MACPH|nr:involucrin repeat protein [Macrophomina phaseolina MS6]
MQSSGRMSYGQDTGLQPPPPLNFGFPSPGSYTAGSLDSPTLGSSVYSPNPAVLPRPPADILEENYQSAVNDSYAEAANRNGKPRTSHSLDPNDAVAMHLLVETAVGDSLGYEILSFEELEALKKERTALTSKMEAVGQKLALETKMRDAAQSLSRLNAKRRGSNGERVHGRSFSRSSQTSNGSNPDSSAKSEAEYTASAQKCDNLSRELWQMERRYRQIDNQLLRHTAGILQMTHKGPSKRSRSRQSLVNGVQTNRPDSPASIYTYENAGARSPVRYDDKDAFDERSLYRSPENLDKLVDALKHGKALTSRPDGLGDVDSPMSADTLKSVDKRLEDLNDRLRQLIIQANPDANKEYDAGPKHRADAGGAEVAANIEEKLDYLDQGLRDIEAEQSNLRTQKATSGMDDRLESINNQLFQLVSRAPREGADEFPPPPQEGAENQINYVEDALYAIEQSQQGLLTQLDEARNADTSELTAYWKEQATEYEKVCESLWEMIRTGHEEARQRKLQRRRVLEADPDAVSDLGEMSPDEDPMPEEFTLSRFSTQVQDMYRRASGLKEKQSILRRQIKQQRELNEKSDAEKEEEFMRLRSEIDRLRHQLHANSGDSDALQTAEERVAQLEAALSEAQGEADTKIAELNQSLEAAKASEAEVARTIEQKEEELAKTDKELRELEGEVVRLQTELTMAKAELDGAYGTRAQRAADIAANPEVKRELEELAKVNAELTSEVARLTEAHAAAARSAKDVAEREKMLREELRDTISEFEEMTKVNVESEKEREGLESVIDTLREKIESLEAQLSDEKMRWLGIKSPAAIPTPGPNGTPGMVLAETTSTKVLREEFRKMMRETRAEAIKALRAEQDERKRLEQILRQLKREQLPPPKSPKSGLSRSMTAA